MNKSIIPNTGRYRHLGRVLSNLADASCGVLAHIEVRVSQALENIREHLGLYHNFSEVHGVLGNLSQAAANLWTSVLYSCYSNNTGLCVVLSHLTFSVDGGKGEN